MITKETILIIIIPFIILILIFIVLALIKGGKK